MLAAAAHARPAGTPLCPICGELGKTELKFRRNDSAIYACHRCRVEFVHPQPSDQTLASIYSEEYFLGSEDERAASRVAELKRATAALYMDAIAPRVKAVQPRLLEIGCGSGDFLMEARSRGFEVEGLEYSEHAVEVANARISRPAVHVGSPETARLPANTYNVIVAFDVIEHVRNATYTLERLHSALAPGGVVAIVTPSLDSWSRRVLGRYWMEYKTEHLTYFGRESLTRLLGKTGFEQIEFTSNYKILSLDYIGRHFDRFRVPVISWILGAILKVLPARLAHSKIKIVASGTMAFATKGG